MPRRHIGALCLAAILCALYLFQLVSPLRLNTDAARFLSLARSAADGHGYLVNGKPDLFPEGYPFALMLLIKAGMGSTLWINALNIACVLGSAWMFWRILSADSSLSRSTRILLSVLPLASWVWSKHAIVPVSENLYLALSMAALMLFCRAQAASGRKALLFFSCAFLVAFASFRVRAVGVSLLGAGLVCVFLHPELRLIREKLGAGIRRRSGVVALVAALVVVSGIWVVMNRQAAGGSSTYTGMLQNAVDRGATSFATAILGHFGELGEVTMNLPATRFPGLKFGFVLIGTIVSVVCLARWSKLARRFPPLAWYLAFYAGIIFLWPFADPRFWMPVIPLIGLSLYLALEPCLENALVRRGLALFVAGFAALGIFALVLQTRVSWSGAQFPMRFGDGTNRDTYRVAFGLARRDEVAEVDESLLKLLLDFEPLAKEKAQ